MKYHSCQASRRQSKPRRRWKSGGCTGNI